MCQWPYLWVISACQSCINRYLVVSFFCWHSEHNARVHSVSFSAMAQFVDTNRGGKTLHFVGYIYTKIRDGANGFQFWRCQNHKAGCLARATSEGSSVVIRKGHNHDTLYEGEGEANADSLSPFQCRKLDSRWIPGSHQAPYWTLSYVPTYFPFFTFLWVDLKAVSFMEVDFLIVDFTKSCSYKNWSCGSWSHKS